MSKRIVIMPTFAEAHMIDCQVDNIANVLKPDVVIFNEGLFPRGPENSSIINEDFIRRYCSDDQISGFDIEYTKEVIKRAKKEYPHIEWHLGIIEYPFGMTAENAYCHSVSNFEDYGITIEAGDVLLPSEADVFYHDDDTERIDDMLNKMNSGDAISTIWLDFVGSQSYVEQKQHPEINPTAKHRRFAVCFSTWEKYHEVVKNFVSQDYRKTTKIVEDLYAYHYPWFRDGKYLELRFRILNRQRGYWETYKKGMDEALNETKNKTFKDQIMVRPHHTGNYKYIKYIDITHPEAIKKHSCYV